MKLPRVVLDLCAGSGEWSKPYAQAGYLVERIDLPLDVRELRYRHNRIHGILAAPPCAIFARSGARWTRTSSQIKEALSIVDACLRAVAIYDPAWWALENPEGSLRQYLGPPTLTFDPFDYGDPYPKRTLLWGNFTRPTPRVLVPTTKNWTTRHLNTPDRPALRAITPAGFAGAFFEANP